MSKGIDSPAHRLMYQQVLQIGVTTLLINHAEPNGTPCKQNQPSAPSPKDGYHFILLVEYQKCQCGTKRNEKA